MTELEQLAHETTHILLRDPLSEFLGLRAEGVPISYSLDDAGRYAGHLCTTVATAFEMTRHALKLLYGGSMPIRGSIRVTVAAMPDEFANGPLARVIGFITGAARDDGFRGLAGRWSRQNLLQFDPEARHYGSVRFERVETGAAVKLLARPVKANPAVAVGPLLQSALKNGPSPDFHHAWLEGVRAVLAAGPAMFEQVS